MKENILNYFYPTFISLFFCVTYFYIRFKIKNAEQAKLKNIKNRKISDAVETDSPVKDQDKQLKKMGISTLEDRFSLIGKILPVVFICLWAVLVSLPYLGELPSVYITILAAIVSVVAGVSLRPFLENLFSGVVISFFKSIKIGDTVIIDDHYGLIEEIGLTYSVLKRWDWNRIVIPNSKLLQKEIQNLTMNDQYIWAYVEFFVAPDSDLEKIETLAIEAAKKSKYFNSAEDPSFWVMGLQKDTINCWLAAWADNPSHAWELRNELRTSLVKVFRKEGIVFHRLQLDTGAKIVA